MEDSVVVVVVGISLGSCSWVDALMMVVAAAAAERSSCVAKMIVKKTAVRAVVVAGAPAVGMAMTTSSS